MKPTLIYGLSSELMLPQQCLKTVRPPAVCEEHQAQNLFQTYQFRFCDAEPTNLSLACYAGDSCVCLGLGSISENTGTTPSESPIVKESNEKTD